MGIWDFEWEKCNFERKVVILSGEMGVFRGVVGIFSGKNPILSRKVQMLNGMVGIFSGKLGV